MTAQQALKWLVVAGALCVGGLFADLRLSGGCLAARVGRSTVTPSADLAVPLARSRASGGFRCIWIGHWFSRSGTSNGFPAANPMLPENARAGAHRGGRARASNASTGRARVGGSGDAAAAQILADRLQGFRVDVCTQFVRDRREPSHQQTVLCSRLPLLQAWCGELEARRDGITPRRGFVFGAYQPSPGKILLVYGLHLKSNREDEPGGAATNTAMREESVAPALAHEQAMVKAYSSLGGCRWRWSAGT